MSAGRDADWFGRRLLGLGRLANVVVVVLALHAALSRWWPRVPEGVAGWLSTMGRATLYLFVVHLPFVALDDELPDPAGAGGVALATAAGVATLAILGWMVRRRLWFRWIPR